MPAPVLFELDGVLVDTRSARAAALAAAFAAEGAHDAVGREYDSSTPFENLVREIAQARADASGAPVLDDTAHTLIALRAEREYGTRLAAGVTLADGAVDLVQALGAECRVGVVTSGRRADAERVLTLAGLESSVRFVTAADDGPAFASAARRFAHAVARIRRGMTPPPTAVIAVVAGASGAGAARAAGAHPVLVDERLPLRTLTPGRLVAALAGVPRSSVAPSRPSSVQR